MHYLTLIEQLYQAFFEVTDGNWDCERDDETQADHEIKRLIAALARQIAQVYQERLDERAREQQEDEESDSHCDKERYDEDANN
jgi:hypothetical protein